MRAARNASSQNKLASCLSSRLALAIYAHTPAFELSFFVQKSKRAPALVKHNCKLLLGRDVFWGMIPPLLCRLFAA